MWVWLRSQEECTLEVGGWGASSEAACISLACPCLPLQHQHHQHNCEAHLFSRRAVGGREGACVG